jgi:tryptophan synthase alpha chain
MNPIDALFQRLATQKRKAFIPFIPAGDPDLAASGLLIQEAARQGASLIEIGFPYSDPIADGSVIQASYTRALAKGVKIDDIFKMAAGLKNDPAFQKADVPLVGMVSYSLVHHRGPAEFIVRARQAGFSGAIVPDLPVDESENLARIAADNDFRIIHLVTPTTPRDRAVRIAGRSTGFLYCVSVVGITGERAQIPPELIEQLRWQRQQTKLPLCVGFGISKPEHVLMLRDHADGIIVGSAIVRLIEQADRKPIEIIVREVGEYVRKLVETLNSEAPLSPGTPGERGRG